MDCLELNRMGRRHGLEVVLGILLLSTGCFTLAPGQGAGLSEGSSAFSPWRDTSALAPSHEPPSRPSSTRRPVIQEPLSCGGQAVPSGWPDFPPGDSNALLAPFLTCGSPTEYVALQEHVDMPRLVGSLTDWDAVRLGALGPIREDAASLLNRKRLLYLLQATEKHGAAHAEVFVRFLLDSAYDDELRELLFWLARDKQLATTLGLMPRARTELEARSLKLSARPDRYFHPDDLLRGAGHAVTDLLSNQEQKNAWYTHYTQQRGQLPPSYQQDLDAVEWEAAQQHYSAGNVALGSVDHLTFGVPLGFYYLVVGTGHGMVSLSRGEYEQATRELTPFALLTTLYVGGKSLRTRHDAGGGAAGVQKGFEAVRGRVRLLAGKTRELQARLGAGDEGLRALARYIQSSREAGRFVAVGGMDAALALYEARGEVSKARPLLSKARARATGTSVTKSVTMDLPGTLASLVNEGAGHTRERVEAKLAAMELESPGPRLSMEQRVMEQHRPALGSPPPEAQGNPRWREYVDYYERRLDEVRNGEASKGPLKWEGYERLRGWFARGMAFERDMVKLLREDAKKLRAERRFLGNFDEPRIETQVGVSKPGSGLRYADVLVLEESAAGGKPRRVETFSFKSRELSGLSGRTLLTQMIADASEALNKYGETLDIRRDSLQRMLGGDGEVAVSKVHLVYEGSELLPADINVFQIAASETEGAVPGISVVFQ